MTHILSVCGVDCSGCEFIKNSQCGGCSATEGKVFWTHHIGVEACPIYTCVKKKRSSTIAVHATNFPAISGKK